MQRIELEAQDKTKLVGSLYLAGKKSIILLHQYKKDRSSWHEFAMNLQANDYTVLAIDLRGHGESQGKHEAFIDKNFQDMLLDAKAAAQFLRTQGYQLHTIIGASIGANTAYRFSADNNLPAILLSPGLIYQGIDINDVTSRAPTLTIVSKDDTYSLASAQELDENNMLGVHELYVIPGAEHGTNMLSHCQEKILSFLSTI